MILWLDAPCLKVSFDMSRFVKADHLIHDS